MPKFFIPAEQTKVMTMKDRGLRVIFDTQEPTPEESAAIMSLSHKAGILFFSDDPLKGDSISPPLVTKVQCGKTPSQRLRAALYREWEAFCKFSHAPIESEEYYKTRMDSLITDILLKLPDPFKDE